jgi:hypothetical protein
VTKVTAVLIVYAIIVIASGSCWICFALSKSSLAAGSNTGNGNVAADADKTKQDADMVTDNATELTGGVTDGVKADGQVDDIVKSNDLERTQNAVTK